MVHDDGFHGADSDLTNNVDVSQRGYVSGRPLSFSFDSSNRFGEETGFESELGWSFYRDLPLRTTLPLPVDPIYSGQAEPGTTLRLTIYNDEGVTVGHRTVLADSGGNWIAGFPGAVIWEHPHSMTVETVGALHTLNDDQNYHMRRYYQPALHPSMFFTPRPTVQSVMQDAPGRVLAAIHEADHKPLQFGTTSYGYNLIVASNSTAGR
jgi:hypothetical protein